MEDLVARLAKELEALCESGSPVVGSTPERRQRVASLAVRRIKSFSRRRVAALNSEQQVRDLAEALVAQLEMQPELVGPLILDYEHVAAALLRAYNSNA
jgi:hypothetical protein